MKKPVKLAWSILALGVLSQAFPLFADDLYLATGSGVSLYDLNSVLGGATSPTASFGPSGAVTGFPDGQGNVWVVTYDSSSGMSTVQRYNGAGNAITGDLFQIASTVENGTVGPGGNLFLSGSSGEVYEYSASTLTQITNWNIATGNANLAGAGTLYTAIGIASNGTNIFTTEGDEGTFIDEWTIGNGSAAFDASVDVGSYGLYGLGLDSSFFAGTTGSVLELGLDGSFENDFAIGGSNLSLSAGAAPFVVSSATPEPGTVPLFVLAGLVAVGGLFVKRSQSGMAPARFLAWTAPFLVLPFSQGAVSLSVNSSAGSANVGSTITVSASASDSANSGATFTYQFNLLPPGLPNYSLLRDYSPADSFPFTTTGSEGLYTIQVIALESNGATASATTQLNFTPVATASTGPVVSATAHPLVAMYSLPPCPVGSQARVHFRLAGTLAWNYTPYQSCTEGKSLNFLIGGMRASSTYTLQHDIFTDPTDALGPVMSFKTQAIPSSALNAIPAYNITVPATAPNSTAYPVLLTTPIGTTDIAVAPFAIDMQGNVLWYLPDFTTTLQLDGYLTHPVPGGTFLVIANQTVQGDKQLLREYDLAGNILRETNATALGNELAAMGTDRIDAISHEIFRFPNGDTGLIANVEKVLPSAYDSNTNTIDSNVDVLGDMAIILDSNFHVKWSWDEFNYSTDFSTKTTSGAALPAYTGVLNETCTVNPGCPPLKNVNPSTGQLYTVANDWTHSNSLAPTPDGNLIISIRHQDMVIKINYNNGSGNGTIMWRFGPQGDFASSVPAGQSPFQFFNTHQHDAEYEPSTGLLSLFDNGNTRVSIYGGHSRGQAWQIDNTNLTATPVVDVDLGAYSQATGSAQRLSNNNYHFYLGYIGPNSQSVEVTTAGAVQFEVAHPTTLGYRSFRMATLYSISGEVSYKPFYEVTPDQYLSTSCEALPATERASALISTREQTLTPCTSTKSSSEFLRQ